jgi:plastocyanin
VLAASLAGVLVAVSAMSPSVDAAQTAPDTTVVIRSTGAELAFQPARLALKNGTRVRIRFINDGALPHNIVFPRTEADIDVLSAAATDAAETGFVPLDLKAQMFAYSALAKPTETAEVTFTMPAPGEYWFVCLYPGHAANMLGTLRSLR